MKARYDLLILGAGAAGFAAATKAVDHGASVAMVEGGTIGGTCVNVGCVPSKHLLTVGEAYHRAAHHAYGGVGLARERLDFHAIIRNKDRLIGRLRKTKYVNVLEALPEVDLFRGRGVFVDAHTVQVNGRRVKGEKVVIATGSSPTIPPLEGLDQLSYLTNVEALSLEEVPERLLVVGGRALALEFAQMYAQFGSEVTLLQRSPRVLPDEEPEVSRALHDALTEEGINIYTGVELLRARGRGKHKLIRVKIGKTVREFVGDQLLLATGRRPNTGGMGLERVGVQTGPGAEVLVNDEMQTTAKHAWAGGDVTGKPMLETVAAKEGAIAAENALANAGKTMDELAVPHAVFTHPQVASVGLTEEQATRRFKVCACRVLEMSQVPKALTVQETRGLIKMVVNPANAQIVGVHIVASLAADMIHEAVLAVKHRLTVDDIIDTVHVFPTMTEAIKLVATAFRRDVARLPCCAE